MQAGKDLFAGLPATSTTAPLGDLFSDLPPEVSVAKSGTDATAPAAEFPPVPPSGAAAAAASSGPAPAFPPMPPGLAQKTDAVEAAEQELLDFIGGVTE